MKPDFELRKAIAIDNTALASVIRQVFHELNAPMQGTAYNDPTTDRLFEKFQMPRSVLWVAVQNNEIVGCCGIYPTEGLPSECAELVRFFLSATARGKGIGRALMQQCSISAAEFGYAQLYLESIPVFDKALRIYEKQGFTYLSQPIANSGHTSCNVWMIKNIDTINDCI